MTRFKHSFLVVLVSLVAAWAVDGADTPPAVEPEIGSVVDRYNGVEVFFNGAISHSAGRNPSVKRVPPNDLALYADGIAGTRRPMTRGARSSSRRTLRPTIRGTRARSTPTASTPSEDPIPTSP
jgi:hypothetical protein